MKPIQIVIGGQYGSEGKGAVIAWMLDPVRHPGPVTVVRTGGPNAGHSMIYKGSVYKMQHIPCAWHHPHAALVLGPGAVIDPVHLLTVEIPMVEKALGESISDRLFIDPMAAVITHENVLSEKITSVHRAIGSTNHGVGAATAERVMRTGIVARDYASLSPYIADVQTLYERNIANGIPIWLETTQGFLLSLTRSGYYPYATSRDITPAQALNDAGLPSQYPHEVTMVIRTFPIRVAGNSGPLPLETTWEELQARIPHLNVPERTTVTNKVRRIAEFSPSEVRKAVAALMPHRTVLTFFDYLRPESYMQTEITEEQRGLIELMERVIFTEITHVSTGFQSIVEL